MVNNSQIPVFLNKIIFSGTAENFAKLMIMRADIVEMNSIAKVIALFYIIYKIFACLMLMNREKYYFL